MRRMAVIALAGALLAAAASGHAQQSPGRHADHAKPTRPAPPPGRDPRNVGPGQPGAPAHLTPEERRQLRRDISDHGRDIYRDRGNR